jgi:putative CocE/NonD family hydrolase
MGPLREANEKYLKNEIPFWNDIMAHETYDDFWQSRNLRPHIKNIKPAVMTVGGWFDAENLFGTLGIYQSVEALSPEACNVLVMGPWYHGAWAHSAGNYLGDIYVGPDTADFYRREIEYPFFMRFLKDADEPDPPEAYIFDTGLNEWKKEAVWPPESKVSARKLQLCSGGRLLWDSCGDRRKNVRDDVFDEYVSDPSRPVPYTDGVKMGMAREYMTADQRFAARRPDVLVYSTDTLGQDVTIHGPVGVSLTVSTTGTDADFVVKLIDVYPEEYDSDHYSGNTLIKGYQQLVRGEPFRGKFRNGFSRPEPFVPGKTSRIEYVMPDIAHTFRKGHRIMAQVQSSWFPLIDRNPQKFMNIRNAKAGDFQKATQRIFHSPDEQSYITLNCFE